MLKSIMIFSAVLSICLGAMSAHASHQNSPIVIRYEQYLNMQRDAHNRYLDQRNLAIAHAQNPHHSNYRNYRHTKKKVRQPARYRPRTLVQDRAGRCYQVEHRRGRQVLKAIHRRACR